MKKLSLEDRKSLLNKFNGAKLNNTNLNATLVKTSTNDFDYCDFANFQSFKKIEAQENIAKEIGIQNPFTQSHETIAKAYTTINGEKYLNFATYDYLGFNGNPYVNEKVYDAMLRYGTSAGASRLVAGERVIHQELENALCEHYRQEAAICFVSGHATNVSVISTLFTEDDLILYDRLSHDSIILGSKFSGARRLAFSHNDMQSLEDLLKKHRDNYKRVLIVTEGVFSMDGNIANLPRLIELKKEYKALLMVDEAHALGVIGKNGLGSFEHFNVDPKDVDIYMGTLSKTLCSCGGYIVGKKELIKILRFSAHAFIYSVGLSPVLAAASKACLELLHQDKESVKKLQDNCKYALEYAHSLNLDTGLAEGTAVLPIIIGSSIKATFLSNLLFENHVVALPIIYPVVDEGKARIRLFLSASHSFSDIKEGLDKVASLMKEAERKESNFVNNKNKEVQV